MSRYLCLLRHAQSADKQTGQSDKERQLSTTGFAESADVGNFLKEKSLIPDLIISSSAVRTKTTSKIITDILAHPSIKIIIREDLYETTISKLLDMLAQLDEEIDNVLLVGHNPIFTSLLDYLTHEQNTSLQSAELVILRFELPKWKDINQSRGIITERFYKKL
ncbi:MAG: histidine phosphatase family protein [Bacteroidota bacterium]